MPLAPAYAQGSAPAEASPDDTDDSMAIIVTAQKRSALLQDIAIPVTAVSAEELAKRQINGLRDIQTMVPSITMGDDLNVPKIAIRGIGLNTTVNGAEAGVALYVDGAVISRPEAQAMSLFDLERVEVLRGPQGTLYGRNAVGGAVNLITAKPSDNVKGYVDVTVGNYNTTNVEAAVGGPLTSVLSARVAVKTENNGGFGKFVGSDIGIDNRNRQMARLQLLYHPNDKFDWLLSGEWFHSDEKSGGPKKGGIIFEDPNNPGVSLLDITGYGGYGVGPRDVGGDYVPYSKGQTWSITSTMNYTLNSAISLTNITNFRRFKLDYSYDQDVSSVPNSPITTGRDNSRATKIVNSDQFSTEFQFKLDTDYVKGVTGLFYFRELQKTNWLLLNWNSPYLGYDRTLDIFEAQGIDPLQALDLCGILDYAYNPKRTDGRPNPVPDLCGVARHTTDAVSIFSQYLFSLEALSPSLANFTVKLGGRYSHEHRTVSDPGVSINNALLTATLILPENAQAQKTFQDFTPEVGIEWRPSKDTLVYYTYSEGFKSGVGETSPGSKTIVDPETIQNHEIGLKTMLLDRHLTINFAAYKYKLQGLQLQRSVQACDGCPPVQRFENATEVSGKGAELELTARVTRHFRINGAVNYLHSVYADYLTFDTLDVRNVVSPTKLANLAPFIQLSGNPTRNSPEWSVNAGAEVDIPVNWFGDGATLTPRVDYFYRSTTYYSDFKRLLEGQKPYSLVDASLTYESANSNLSVSLWAKNITDELVIAGTFPLRTHGLMGNSYLPPRTFGGSVRYKF